jgi:hypothetical protein
MIHQAVAIQQILRNRKILGRIRCHARAVSKYYEPTKNHCAQREQREKYPERIFLKKGRWGSHKNYPVQL